MPKHRLRFSKEGRAKYISHLDLMRTFQRAFLRAGLSIRHTEGFNPHAFVSIALPLPVGCSSECELLEFELLDGTPLDRVPALMNTVLPEGIAASRCYEARRPIGTLAYVDWEMTLDYGNAPPSGVEDGVCRLLTRDSWVVTKASKKAKSGKTELDIIPLIKRVSFTGRGGGDALQMRAVLSAQNPGLNPKVFLQAVTGEAPEWTPEFAAFHRVEILDGNLNPFE